MDNLCDILDTVMTAIGHSLFTAFSFSCTHWNVIGGATLMLLQGIYLIKKIKDK